MALTVQEINRSIIWGQFTPDELTSISQAIVFARSQQARAVRRTLAVGDAVKFRGRSGIVESGVISKIMIKRALVKTPTTTWRVPMSLLEAA